MYSRSRGSKNRWSKKSVTFRNEIRVLILWTTSLSCENFRKLHFIHPILCGVKVLCYQYYISSLSVSKFYLVIWLYLFITLCWSGRITIIVPCVEFKSNQSNDLISHTGADPAQNLTGSNCNPKKFWSPESGKKNFLGLLGGSRTMLPPESFENLTSQMG